MIVLHAVFPLDPDQREAALVKIEELVEQSQAEDGMIDYHATTDITNPNVVRFFERYEDETAFKAHTQTDHFKEFELALPDLLAGEPTVMRFEIDTAQELDL